MRLKHWQTHIVYRVLSWCLSPLVLAHLIWRSLHDGGAVYLKQRLGLSVPSTGEAIWIHAASVGEVNTAAPLISALAKRYPQLAILISTNTPTGRAAIARQLKDCAQGVYLPLDYTFAVKRFFRSNPIRCGIIIETEIWPMLLEHKNFPVVIINGRLSDKTLKVTQRGCIADIAGAIYRRAVTRLTLVLARGDADADGFVQLGVATKRIQTIGNLKFAGLQQDAGLDNNTNMESNQPLPRQFCLLASTHEDEEAQLARHWLQRQRKELLVIAPRHPDRSAVLIRQLTAQIGVSTKALAIRSKADSIDTNTCLYLADTLGEMDTWYRHAKAVFIGGSLVPHGGHNMLEPAQYAQAVVIGQHTHNFKDEMSVLLAADAIVQVNNATEAVQALIDILDAPVESAARGRRAQAVIATQAQIQQDYLDALSAVIDGAVYPSRKSSQLAGLK